jgi:hypothetical protein
MQMRANLYPIKFQSFSMRARITRSASMQMRANVTPRFRTTTLPNTFMVEANTQVRLTMLFYTQGLLGQQTMQMGARIIKQRVTRFTGYFAVAPAIPAGGVMSFDFSGRANVLQTFGARANIIH